VVVTSYTNRESAMRRISSRLLLKGTAWTIGAFGVGQALRLGQSIILARLLTPDIFGIMLIVGSLNTGIQLMSDVGIGKGIVYHKEADDPDFYNTAWTLQAIRSIVLWLVALTVAVPVASFYELPTLVFVIPITALSFVLNGFSSISLPLLQKRLKFAELNIFTTIVSLISTAASVFLAYLSPTIWAPVLAGLFGAATSMIGSYFMLSDIKQRFHLSKRYASKISQFGRWIFISSIVYFLSTNYDRLYLAKAVPLELLGVYGIARNISELISSFFLSLANGVVFPFVASHSEMSRADFREQLATVRAKLLLLAALGLSLFVATGDLAIKLLYDQRYHAAGWMLPVLIIGSWFSILANINEATLLGLGKASYTAIANGSKFAVLIIGLPLGIKLYGLVGAIMVVVLAELFRYVPMLAGMRTERFAFSRQDFFITVGAFSLMGFLSWLRWALGFGTSFETLPIDWASVFGST
jgi:O-antigen/teichoic acid export membrane protein